MKFKIGDKVSGKCIDSYGVTTEVTGARIIEAVVNKHGIRYALESNPCRYWTEDSLTIHVEPKFKIGDAVVPVGFTGEDLYVIDYITDDGKYGLAWWSGGLRVKSSRGLSSEDKLTLVPRASFTTKKLIDGGREVVNTSDRPILPGETFTVSDF